MLFNSYKHFLETPNYNKIIGEDYLIVEFKCPITERLFKYWSECHSIAFVLKGQKKWATPEDEWLVTEGQSIFVQKGAYLNEQYFDEGFCVLMFFMKDDFIKNCIKNDVMRSPSADTIKIKTEPIYRINISESLLALYNSFFSYLKQDTKVPQKIIELKFREMILNIITNPNNTGVRDYMFMLADWEETPIPKVMEEHFFYNLSLDEFARLCGKSLSSFKRDFKKLYKTSPRRWLTSKRLEYAKQLLLRSNDNIQEICYDIGFENDSHFNRIFKETYGLTPLQFRKNKTFAL